MNLINWNVPILGLWKGYGKQFQTVVATLNCSMPWSIFRVNYVKKRNYLMKKRKLVNFMVLTSILVIVGCNYQYRYLNNVYPSAEDAIKAVRDINSRNISLITPKEISLPYRALCV